MDESWKKRISMLEKYFRASVREMVKTYPLLAGMGITAGEGMPHDMDSKVKERWLWDTYGEGVRDALKDEPQRVFPMIHRFHWTAQGDILDAFKDYPGPFEFSFKYSVAHMYSITKPLFIQPLLENLAPGRKTWLTVRNDDMYYMRWGDPDFVRAYLGSLPDLTKIAGFYMGPDGYTWGRELVSRTPASPRQLVIEKMWYEFLLWGRLSFDPSIPDSRFKAILAARFPTLATAGSSASLFDAWGSVSKILPLFTRFYWGNLDYKWYPEASSSQSGFESVQQLIDGRYVPMTEDEDGQTPRIMSVKAFINGEAPAGRLTPLEVAEAIERYAEAGIAGAARLQPGSDKALGSTLADIRAMAWLGRYYAAKTRGAVDLARYQKDRRQADHAGAIAHLKNASAAWREYAAIWSSQYVGQHLTRMGPRLIDIAAIQADVDRDVDRVQ